MLSKKPVRVFAIIVISMLSLSALVGFKLPDIGGKLGDKLKIPGVPTQIDLPMPNLDSLLDRGPAIKAGKPYADIPIFDGWKPKKFKPLEKQPRKKDGTFILKPGTYDFMSRSYCLWAGTPFHKGSGYLQAPMEGEQRKIIRNIMKRSVDHQDIKQSDIQTLVWAVLARAKFNNLNPDIRAIGEKLLTKKEIHKLNGGALGLIPKNMRDKLFAKLDPQLRRVLDAEAEIRSMVSAPSYKFEELARVAVPKGVPIVSDGKRSIPHGRWSYHPNGFFIRAMPSGYSQTYIQLHMPRSYTIVRDSLGRITSIADKEGYRTETVYNDSIKPLAIKGEKNLSAYAFSLIRFTRPKPGKPGKFETAEIKNRGWTFVNRPPKSVAQTENGEPDYVRLAYNSDDLSGLMLAQGGGSPIESYESWRRRYDSVQEQRERYNYYRERWDRANNPPDSSAIDQLGDMEHYQDGLEAATRGGPSERYEWLIDHEERQRDALRHATRVLEEGLPGGSSGGSSEGLYNPGGEMAVPGNGQQRLGVSGSSYR